MTCKCGFHLNPPNTPCKCDGKRPECDKQKDFYCDCEVVHESKKCKTQCGFCEWLDIQPDYKLNETRPIKAI